MPYKCGCVCCLERKQNNYKNETYDGMQTKYVRHVHETFSINFLLLQLSIDNMRRILYALAALAHATAIANGLLNIVLLCSARCIQKSIYVYKFDHCCKRRPFFYK